MSLRFHLPPGGDVPPAAAARRMGQSLAEFERDLPGYLARGFPPADPTSGNYCLEAIDLWRTGVRYPQLFPDRALTLTPALRALDAKDVTRSRIAGLGRG